MSEIERLEKEIAELKAKDKEAKEIAKSARRTMKEKMKLLQEEQEKIKIAEKLHAFDSVLEYWNENPQAYEHFENWKRSH